MLTKEVKYYIGGLWEVLNEELEELVQSSTEEEDEEEETETEPAK